MARNVPPQPSALEVATMRQQIEELHEKVNARLSGTFKGTLEEKVVKTNSTGRFTALRIN